MPRQIVPVSDVASILLTQDEGDLRYLPITYSPPPVDLSLYYTKVQGDARYEPVDTMYTKAESDAKYSLTGHLHTGVYQPVGSYSLTTHNHDTAYSALSHLHDGVYQPVGSYSLTTHEHDAAYFNVAGDTIYGGGIMIRDGGTFSIADSAFTISAGWKYVDGVGLTHIVNGSSVGTYFTSNGSLFVNGTMDSRPAAEGLAGSWLTDTAGNRRSFVGNDDATGNAWRVYSNLAGQQGNKFTVNLHNNIVSTPGEFHVSGGITNTGSLTFNGSVGNIASTANIQLSPAGTIVHPSGDGTCHLGWPGLNWLNVYTNNVNSPGQMGINAGAHLILTTAAVNWNIYHRPKSHNWFDGDPTNGQVSPEIDNRLVCGGVDSHRWKYVSAVNGSIQTSNAIFKKNYTPLDPKACTDAVLGTDWVSFEYLPAAPPPAEEGETPNQRIAKLDEYRAEIAKDAFVRKQNGYVLGHETHKTHALFGLADRTHSSPSADLGILACALQAALKRIAVLEGKPV